MSIKKRQSFSSEFKAKVAIAALRNDRSINEIGLDFGVHPTQIAGWKKELQDNSASLFEGKRGPKNDSSVVDQDKLYAEIGRLKVDLDWLKKKSGLCR